MNEKQVNDLIHAINAGQPVHGLAMCKLRVNGKKQKIGLVYKFCVLCGSVIVLN